MPLAAFDNYIAQSMDNSQAFIAGFQSTYECPGFMGHNIRFHQSLMCNYFVSFSLSKCAPAPVAYKPLCQSSCFGHINSVNSLFANPNVCTPSPAAMGSQARQIFMTLSTTPGNVANSNVYFDSCYSMFTSNDTAVCSSGTAADVIHAGFSLAADAAPFCAMTNLDQIDATLCKNMGSVSATSTAPIKGINPLGPLTRAQKFALILPARDTPWIASGIAWAVMAFASLTWMTIVKSTDWVGRATISVQPEGMSQLPERYKNMNEPEKLAGVGTIARGRATLRRQQMGGNTGRKSVFESMFGGGARPDSEYQPRVEVNSEYGAESAVRSPSEYQSEYQSEFQDESEYDDDNGSYYNDDDGLLMKMEVVEEYMAQQPDELTLKFGEVIVVLESYDDGWASAKKESTGAIGAVPLSCLALLGETKSGKARGISMRGSSQQRYDSTL
ncbi:hypothetical protein HDU98_004277 [Podochytrium sp. JEL0797]|nr:hypothetical protein HDU98_004277 [Podochytrium sp. JEL0797]